MKTSISEEALVGCYALSAYLYNTAPLTFANDRCMREPPHPVYAEEKSELFHNSPARALGDLDNLHFKHVMEIAMERHGEFARQAARLALMMANA
jgi:hypothetical protein